MQPKHRPNWIQWEAIAFFRPGLKKWSQGQREGSAHLWFQCSRPLRSFEDWKDINSNYDPSSEHPCWMPPFLIYISQSGQAPSRRNAVPAPSRSSMADPEVIPTHRSWTSNTKWWWYATICCWDDEECLFLIRPCATPLQLHWLNSIDRLLDSPPKRPWTHRPTPAHHPAEMLLHSQLSVLWN